MKGYISSFIQYNWALIVSVIAGVVLLKTSNNKKLNVVLVLVFVGITITLLTHVDFLPTFSEFFLEVKHFVR